MSTFTYFYSEGSIVFMNSYFNYKFFFYFFLDLVILLHSRGFDDYLVSGSESAYQQLCHDITVEFNDCSKQVSQSLNSTGFGVV